MRLIEDVMKRLEGSGRFDFDEGAETAAQDSIAVLIGRLQLQQALGSVPSLDSSAIEQRTRRLRDRLYARPR